MFLCMSGFWLKRQKVWKMKGCPSWVLNFKLPGLIGSPVVLFGHQGYKKKWLCCYSCVYQHHLEHDVAANEKVCSVTWIKYVITSTYI